MSRKKSGITHIVVCFAVFAAVLCVYGVGYGQETDGQLSAAPIDLSDYLTGPVERGESPGLIAAVIDEHGVKAIGASGLRRQGSRSPITVNDLVHIGSNTKAMTATMLATSVADATFPEGWETTIGDVFPKLAKKIHPKYRSVTLSQLVRMEAGMPHMPKNQWAYANQTDIKKRRYGIIRDSLKQPPTGPKGKYLYSNLSYVVAASLAEGRTGKSWESLMEERLFAPLGITAAGFGPPSTPRKVDQPWGHRRDFSGDWSPNRDDNDPSLGPAGTVHISVKDWAKFIQLWLPNREPEILDRKTLNSLTRPSQPSKDYAAGWFVWPRPWAGGNVLHHDGTNLNWRTALWIAPNRNVAYLAVANAANYDDGDDTYWTIDSVIGSLIQSDF